MLPLHIQIQYLSMCAVGEYHLSRVPTAITATGTATATGTTATTTGGAITGTTTDPNAARSGPHKPTPPHHDALALAPTSAPALQAHQHGDDPQPLHPRLAPPHLGPLASFPRCCAGTGLSAAGVVVGYVAYQGAVREVKQLGQHYGVDSVVLSPVIAWWWLAIVALVGHQVVVVGVPAVVKRWRAGDRVFRWRPQSR